MWLQRIVPIFASFLVIAAMSGEVAAGPASAQESGAKYKVWGPVNHTALAGDLHMHFLVPPPGGEFRVTLLTLVNGEELPIVRKDLPRNRTSGMLEFPCGLVDRAGVLVFVLQDRAEEQTLARSPKTTVWWPEVTVHVPLILETLSPDVVVHVYVGPPELCAPRPGQGYPVTLELVYFDTWSSPVISSQPLPQEWWARSAHEVVLSCELFDRAGAYKVQLRAGLAPPYALIAQSETIRVRWSSKFSVRPLEDPGRCAGSGLQVAYNYPRCGAAGGRDRVRIEGYPGPEHLGEIRLPPGRHSVTLPCRLFARVESLAQVCFVYVAVARSGAVSEHSRHCITAGGAKTADPLWGEWTEWSPCLARCGPRAVHSRYRLCQIAPCQGPATQEKPCELAPPCPDSIETSTTTHQLDFCKCGCVLNVTDERAEYSLADGVTNCPDYPLQWRLEAEAGGVVVWVVRVSLAPEVHWLLVREGPSRLSPVLAVVTGREPPPPLTSSSPSVLLELHRANASVTAVPLLLVAYSRIDIPDQDEPHPPMSSVLASATEFHHPPSVRLTILVIASVVLSVTLVFAAVYAIRMLALRFRPDTESQISEEAPTTSSSELSGHVAPPPTPNKTPHTSVKMKRRRKKRESALPLTGSLSEFSMSEDGFEYDYYDYGMKQEPGSFFTRTEWPHFVPLPTQQRLTP